MDENLVKGKPCLCDQLAILPEAAEEALYVENDPTQVSGYTLQKKTRGPVARDVEADDEMVHGFFPTLRHWFMSANFSSPSLLRKISSSLTCTPWRACKEGTKWEP